MRVGTGTRDDTGWTKLSSWTVIRPPDVAAIWSNCDLIQSRAAPMPRFGSSWDESVWRVPNETSVLSKRSRLRALTCASVARTSAGGFHQCVGRWASSRPRAADPPSTTTASAAAVATTGTNQRSLGMSPPLVRHPLAPLRAGCPEPLPRSGENRPSDRAGRSEGRHAQRPLLLGAGTMRM
jgi:hypothetical protein